MAAEQSGKVLVKTLADLSKDLTISDASTQSGLSLRDAETGLHYLVSEYRGHLSATEKGELLFRFPSGFSKPWEKIEALDAAWQKVKKTTLGISKFVVRAWISVVMVAYVAIFAAILIGLSFANKSDRDDRGGSFGGTILLHTLLRLVMDSLFWTFHPFSPFAVQYRGTHGHQPRRQKSEIPFYEKVNRFFFGPAKPTVDPLEMQRKILSEIRVQKGRIGLSDVMRVTGLPRDRADLLMARLMLDYEGEVQVSDGGGILYLFPVIRKTAHDKVVEQPESIWSKQEKLLPLTGNTGGSNFLIAGLNGFNLLMSTVAISGGWTLAKLQWMFTAGAQAKHLGFLAPMPEGTPLLLGWIPFWFSLALFMLPLVRWSKRGSEQKKVNHENGRRGLLWAVLNRLTRKGIGETTLKEAWKKSAGVQPGERELTREVVKLGGELEVDDGGHTYYRFRDLEAEASGLESERKLARDEEKEVGKVVYSSL